MMYTFPLAITGVDWPGKSALHSGLAGSILSGRPFSLEEPFWFGPRQVSQPLTGAPGAASANAAKRVERIEIFMDVKNRFLVADRNIPTRRKDCNIIILTRII